MHEITGNKIYLLARSYQALLSWMPDNYHVKETFNNKAELIRYLYQHYDADTRSYFFDGKVDLSGSDTEDYGTYSLSANGSVFEKRINKQRKPWMFAEEINADWLEVINPYEYQREVNKLISRYGGKKQGPLFRQEPIPRTGKRTSYFRSIAITSVKHTSWYREEKARQKMDKEWDQHQYPLPLPHFQDWNFYHNHSPRESRSWKNKKIQRQWMKRLAK